jgi:phosphate transport system permease protein
MPKTTKLSERLIEFFLFFCALATVLTTFGIILVLLINSISFFSEVSFLDFITGTKWAPVISNDFGILPLLSGTLLTSLVAMTIALPIGLSIAIYLSQYATERNRKIIKPLLELLAAVPTIVYGFFALTIVTPFLKSIYPELEIFNSLSAGIVMGIMIIPYISSLSEDALFAVPKSLREAAFGLGSTRLQASMQVVLPAASSGIIVSIILAISRAIGETMIVAVAAGQQPTLTFNPTVAIQTITSYIVQISKGDVPRDSIAYNSIFAAGITLFVITFILNNISFYIKRKYQEKYE